MNASRPQHLFNRDFLAYWLGIAFTAVGDALSFVAMPFLVIALGGGGAQLATVTLLASLPRFAGPVLGALADRLPLRPPLVIAAFVRCAVTAAAALLALQGALPLWALYLAAPMNGVVTIFTFSAGNVALPRLVPTARLSQANALMQAAVMGVPMVGLGAGGALVAAVGPAATLALAVPSLALLAPAALLVRFPAGSAAGTTSLLADLAGGVRFMLTRPPLLVVLLGTLVLNAGLNLLNVLMPLAMERSGAGARGYGLFESLVSAGTLLGILLITTALHKVTPRGLVAGALAVVATGFGMLATGTTMWLLGGGAVIGTGLGMGEVSALTMMQLIVPDGSRGKVMGLVLPANALGLTIGAAVAGAVAPSPSHTPALLAAAGAVLALAVVWAALGRGLRVDPASAGGLT